jgi:tetratricopeptide (TPR) repeat protein
MNTERLEQLLEFLKDDPDDPFNLYAVANEYRHANPEKSRLLMDQLLREHPDYLPTYYHAAQLYIEFEMPEKASQILEQGIALAREQQDNLALRELRNAASELLFDD